MKSWIATAGLVVFPLLPLPLLADGQALHAADTVAVRLASQEGAGVGLDGKVEAIRQTSLAAQVAGAVVDIPVKVGERVKAGQILARLDSRSAAQNAVASAAQVAAAQAQLRVASRDLARQKSLQQRGFVSSAALERAQGSWEAAQAQVEALQANTRAAQAQTDYYLIRAPYAGIIGDIPIKPGDMAMPGRELMVIYDPSAFRVTAAVPESLLPGLAGQRGKIHYEIPGSGTPTPSILHVELLPTIDPSTHTAEIRLNLPVGSTHLSPGMFARVWLPAVGDQAGDRRYVPARSVIRRGEVNAVYVLDAQGKARLRQVRLGPQSGEEVEILSGVHAGERVLTDPRSVVLRP